MKREKQETGGKRVKPGFGENLEIINVDESD